MLPFQFYPQIVVRTPRLPYDSGNMINNWEDLLEDAAFMESVYLASPTLYDACMKYRNGFVVNEKTKNKISRSLMKYWWRSANRATPFGLFSGCHVSEWSDEDIDVLKNRQSRHTVLDIHYLRELGKHLSRRPCIFTNLLFYANNSLYKVQDEWRYIECQQSKENGVHQISALAASDYLDLVINRASEGIALPDIKALLVSPDIAAEEADDFIEVLINAQVLISELEPALHGDGFLQQILKTLQRVYDINKDEYLLSILNTLYLVAKKLEETDRVMGNDETVYEDIMRLLRPIGPAFDERNLFHVDLSKATIAKGFPASLQPRLLQTLKIMNCFSAKAEEGRALQNFATVFEKRYGNNTSMPILEVLDPEFGIIYVNSGQNEDSPLLAALVFPSKKEELGYVLQPFEKLLQKKMVQLLVDGAAVIKLYDSDCQALVAHWEQLPPSMHLLFRLVSDEDIPKIYIESCGGSSAINLLSRFAFANKEINDICQNIAEKEQSLNSDITFAEIAHFGDSRAGNILCHPAFRAYEIPCLSLSSRPRTMQIPLQDIMVCVKDGTVIVYDKKNGTHIIPRLSSAHNYTYNALPIYQFLCDLQFQGLKRSINFNWGALQNLYTYLPRVEYDGIILSAARWRFTREDLSDLFRKGDITTTLKSFIEKYTLPGKVLLIEDDNELPIDFNDPMAVAVFIDYIRQKEHIELRECFDLAPQFRDENGHYYQGQVLAPLINTNKVYQQENYKVILNAAIPQCYPPGMQWLYYKIYLSAQAGDRILSQLLKSLTQKLLSTRLISSFFFIRYMDPDYHIRLRLKLQDEVSLSDVINHINDVFKEVYQSGLVRDVQIDTYKPELSRYGTSAITLSEAIFYHDSIAALDIISANDTADDPQASWQAVIPAIDNFLNACGYTIRQKQQITSELKEAFAREFTVDHAFKKQLGLLYREQKQNIDAIMESNIDTEYAATLHCILSAKNEKIKPLVSEIIRMEHAGILDVPLNHLIKSHIHMLVNRLIATQQREHELVLYDFLYQYYSGQIARSDNRKTSS
ncbi:hypothetical protein DBR32_01600 [Taibaiella sp. KBW10]|uniref:lantibiotic dehydratase n=1 Tax=Taibaiella sp. KBW10 TaxID=2153357 RepID=UPI000F5A11B4|nr:lantibiotic dehydratase [Taibaiella sp. KBW10]RQO32330.1 hypothetical protein DBR32_01600 [Taibaiella sp. KBW10]